MSTDLPSEVRRPPESRSAGEVTQTVGQPRAGALARWLETQPRAVSRAELLARWSTWSLDTAISRGTVVRVLPGVYAGPSHAAEALVRAQAVCLWSRRATVGGLSAMQLCNHELPAPTTVDIVLPYGSRVRSPDWVRVREQRGVRTWCHLREVRCLVPEAALLDAWHREPVGIGRDVVYRALWLRVCTPGQLARALAAAPRVSGRRDLARLLAQFEAGATSPLEVMARREVFVGRRFGEFEWQAELVIAGRPRRPDMLHRRARLVVELDGRRYHSGDDAAARDRARDTEFAAAGFTTLRFGFQDLCRRPEWCRAAVSRAVEARL